MDKRSGLLVQLIRLGFKLMVTIKLTVKFFSSNILYHHPNVKTEAYIPGLLA